MSMRAFVFSLLAAGLVTGAVPAAAQPLPPPPAQGGRLDIPPLNFDLWCQETQKLPPDRCDKRLPQDDAAFNAYRQTIEKYEVPYLKQRQDEQILNRAVLHADPSQNPVNNSQQPPAPNP